MEVSLSLKKTFEENVFFKKEKHRLYRHSLKRTEEALFTCRFEGLHEGDYLTHEMSNAIKTQSQAIYKSL